MNERVTREVRRLRQADPYMTMQLALQLARWRTDAPMREDGDTWELDGFTLRVTTEYDDYPYDGDDMPMFGKYPSAETISVRGVMPADDEYAETPYYPRTERIAYYRGRKCGASKSVAVERAEADMLRDVYAALRQGERGEDYVPYVVCVTATREGVELGRAYLGGVTFGGEYGDAGRYLAEVSDELADEAITEARATLARLCEAGASS